MLVILLNCVTLGMYQPCDDMDCLSDRCKILQVRPAHPTHDALPTHHTPPSSWDPTLEPHSVPSSRPPLAPQVFDDFIFVFFAMEMVLKMVALGIFGKKCYLGDTWNRLDFFIVMAG